MMLKKLSNTISWALHPFLLPLLIGTICYVVCAITLAKIPSVAFVQKFMLAGVLASARLYLGCHDGRQVLAGFTGGFAVATLALLLF